MFSYPCRMKGCKTKKRNGRCSIDPTMLPRVKGSPDCWAYHTKENTRKSIGGDSAENQPSLPTKLERR